MIVEDNVCLCISSGLKDNWLKIFTWLRFSQTDSMTCFICCEFNSQGSSYFISGNRNLKKSNLDEQEKSDFHIDPLRNMKAR